MSALAILAAPAHAITTPIALSANALQPAPSQDKRARAIRAEGIRVQYAGMPNSYIGSAVMASILAAILQTDMAAHIWGPWLAGMYMQALGRWWLRRRFIAAAPPDHDITRWGRYAAVGSLVSGSVWGIGAVLGFVNAQGIMQLIWTPMIIMLGAVATFAATSYLPAFYTFFYPAALPGIAMFLVQNDNLRFLIGIAFLCYLPLVTRFAHVLHQSFVDSTRLRFENLELVEALRVEKAAAEEANLAKSRFLAAASHDLRQPMHALSLFIESLSRSTLPERETGLLTNMRKSADAMESLFDALLDVSRLDAGIVEARRNDFRVLPLLTRLHEEFEPLARARGLDLRLRVHDAVVYTDPVLLNRILTNLLSNAVRYGVRPAVRDCVRSAVRDGAHPAAGAGETPAPPPGGILLAVRPRAGRLAIEVWDCGIGIATHERDSIFREFYQAGNPERDRSKGLGLGLAIVQRLVRLLDLGLEVQSRPGRGSLFRVLVPAGDPDSSNTPPALDRGTGAAPAPVTPLAGRLVLVIDDEAAVCDAMAALLTSWGCSVRTAGSAAQMKAALLDEQRVPDLIICDYRLRGEENGIEVIDDLRGEYNEDIPGLIITGDTMPARLVEARDSGLPILHKPLNPAKLRAMIGSLTQGTHGTRVTQGTQDTSGGAAG